MPYDDLKKALERLPQMEDDTGPDFELVDCSQEPIWLVVAFLQARQLGPAGLDLLDALKFRHALTQPQEELLAKVVKKMEQPDEWVESILQEIEEFNQALAQVDAECSTSALNPGVSKINML